MCGKPGGACVPGCSGRAPEEHRPVRRRVGRRHRARPVRRRRRGAPEGRLQARSGRRGRRDARRRGAPSGRERRLVRSGPRGGGLGRGRERGRRRGARRREAQHAGVGDGQRVHTPVGERQACAHDHPTNKLPYRNQAAQQAGAPQHRPASSAGMLVSAMGGERTRKPASGGPASSCAASGGRGLVGNLKRTHGARTHT